MTQMVVSPQPRATEAGLEVLQRGGNAVDAAVTAAFVQGVESPESCGLGGGGEMLISLADSGPLLIEFHSRAGSKVRADQWERAFLRESDDRNIFVLNGEVNDVGYQSVCVPGTVAGLYAALSQHGTMSWDQALRPAIELARRGVPVTGAMRANWLNPAADGTVDGMARLMATLESRRVYTKDGQLYEVGEVLPLPDYARTLERLASYGPDDFYRGEIGQRIAADFEDHDGFLDQDDLVVYHVRQTRPLISTYRDLRIVTVPPPCGGVHLLQILNLLEGFSIAELIRDDVRFAQILVEAMAWALSDRVEFLGDPEFTSVPVARLVDKAYAAEAREQIVSGRRFHGQAFHETPHTTHLNTIDSSGNAVSLTHTLGAASGVVTPGLGFMYNNYMNIFDPRPGRPNSIAPGKTRITMMCPTMIFDGERLRIILGAPGGTRIMSSVLQTVVNIIDRGHDALHAVCHPRIDCQRAGFIEAEGRVPRRTVDGLRELGYTVNHHPLNWDRYFASAQVITISSAGAVHGASDPRHDGGMALGAD
jgi:gamma-glutamyltranspeptidase/glutathione hydrolase